MAAACCEAFQEGPFPERGLAFMVLDFPPREGGLAHDLLKAPSCQDEKRKLALPFIQLAFKGTRQNGVENPPGRLSQAGGGRERRLIDGVEEELRAWFQPIVEFLQNFHGNGAGVS